MGTSPSRGWRRSCRQTSVPGISDSLRRVSGQSAGQAASPTFGRLRIDLGGHRVWVDDARVDLTPVEFELLSLFLHRPGKALTRDVLLEEVWKGQTVTDRAVDTHIKRLRQKLGGAGEYIETLRGVGYRLRNRPD